MLYLPQRGVLSSLFLPSSAELPKGQATAIVFDFPGTGPQATAVGSNLFHREFLLTHFTGTSDAPAGQAFVQWVHSHGTAQRAMNSQRMRFGVVAGKNGNALILRSPYLLGVGDTLTAKIANTGNDGTPAANPVAANIQIVAWGVYL